MVRVGGVLAAAERLAAAETASCRGGRRQQEEAREHERLGLGHLAPALARQARQGVSDLKLCGWSSQVVTASPLHQWSVYI
jgi:hypothetical protein